MYRQRLSQADIDAVLTCFHIDINTLLEFGKHNAQMPTGVHVQKAQAPQHIPDQAVDTATGSTEAEAV